MQSTIQTYPSYNSLPHPQHYQPMQMPSYSRAVGSGWNEECQDISTSCNELLQMQQPNNFNQHHLSTMQQQRHGMIAGPSSSVIPAVIPPPLELNLQNNEMVPHVQRNDVRKATKKINRRPSTKRGNYATYTPEFRLEVGKFAATHGCQEASQHFKVFIFLPCTVQYMQCFLNCHFMSRKELDTRYLIGKQFFKFCQPQSIFFTFLNIYFIKKKF